jgi:hypothetical protein
MTIDNVITKSRGNNGFRPYFEIGDDMPIEKLDNNFITSRIQSANYTRGIWECHECGKHNDRQIEYLTTGCIGFSKAPSIDTNNLPLALVWEYIYCFSLNWFHCNYETYRNFLRWFSKQDQKIQQDFYDRRLLTRKAARR